MLIYVLLKEKTHVYICAHPPFVEFGNESKIIKTDTRATHER